MAGPTLRPRASLWQWVILLLSSYALAAPQYQEPNALIAARQPQITPAPDKRRVHQKLGLHKRDQVWVGSWTSLGCIQNTYGNMAPLSPIDSVLHTPGPDGDVATTVYDHDLVVPEYCQSVCQQYFFTYCAAQEGGNCYGGNDFNSGIQSLATAVDGTCDSYDCAGDPQRKCGDHFNAVFYSFDGVHTPNLTSTTGWQEVGCFTASGNPNDVGHVLDGPSTLGQPMDASICASFASSLNVNGDPGTAGSISYFNLNYQQECTSRLFHGR
ncbi:hypothetical protein BT63DRAFT_280742 [Microthyrium microscopicum]|uniref:WSC domain-containing protein n=1 Tax=Microthyrium microscopicum TaxID=703497 RepID=A0A6A6U8T6_9PEZI|nr:hypothetical protein BT63DRAFT_280742 [Microthyrium microscopicum]